MNKMKHHNYKSQKRKYGRSERAFSLIEAVVGLCVIIPLILFAVNVAVITCMAQANEEFAEQLARLCSTVQNQNNAQKACQDVLAQYQRPGNVKDMDITKVVFDQGLQQVTVSTSMDVRLPVPMFGQSSHRLNATVMQPVISMPAAQ
jgi:type II secretory pathway pseudopilin PulG